MQDNDPADLERFKRAAEELRAGSERNLTAAQRATIAATIVETNPIPADAALRAVAEKILNEEGKYHQANRSSWYQELKNALEGTSPAGKTIAEVQAAELLINRAITILQRAREALDTAAR